MVQWRGEDDWRAVYGITYGVEGVGKRGPLKAKSLNTMPHIHRHKEATHKKHTLLDAHTDTLIGSGLGWGLLKIAVHTEKQAETDQCHNSYFNTDTHWMRNEQ